MDEHYIEVSEALIEAQRLDSIRKCQARAGQEHDPLFDGEHCVDCGDPVGGPRLRLGKVRCIECQTVKERTR